jgi:thioesterase domain-containing protein
MARLGVEELRQELQALEQTLQAAQNPDTDAQQQRVRQLRVASDRINALSAALSDELKAFCREVAALEEASVSEESAHLTPTPSFEPTRHGVRAGRQHPARPWQSLSCRLPQIYWQGDHCWLVEEPLTAEPAEASRQRQQRQALEAWLVKTRRRILNDFSGL